jgi:hypothetical protein
MHALLGGAVLKTVELRHISLVGSSTKCPRNAAILGEYLAGSHGLVYL